MKVFLLVLLFVALCSAAYQYLPVNSNFVYVDYTNANGEFEGLFYFNTSVIGNSYVDYVEIDMFPLPSNLADASPYMTLSVQGNSSSNNYTDLISSRQYFAAISVFYSDVINVTSVTIDAIATTTNNNGFAIRACIGGCKEVCPENCNQHGFCSLTAMNCTCASAYDGVTCGHCPACDTLFGIVIGSLALTVFLLLVLPILVCCCFIAIAAYCCCCRKRHHHHHHYASIQQHHH